MRTGPGVRIALRVGAGGLLTEARFETQAFDGARPVASRLCELLTGATIDEASRISARALARIVGCAEDDRVTRQVAFALGAALTPFLSRGARHAGPMVCTCFSVEESAIRAAVREHGCRTVAEIQEHLPVCMGCGTCRPDVEQLLAD